MQKTSRSYKVILIVSLLCLAVAGWREYGLIQPLLIIVGGIVLTVFVQHNTRKRKRKRE